MQTQLKRCIGPVQLTLYCIANVIGAGLYVLTGKLIRDHAGASTGITYLVAAFTTLFTSMCYAEFSTLMPRAGSAYTYTYIMLGELLAFIIGWTMISDILVGTTAVAKAFSGTINWLSKGAIHKWFLQHLGSLGQSDVWEETPDLIAAAFLLLLIIITMSGANISLTINVVLSSIQILCITVIIVACFVFGSPENYQVDGGFAPFGINGILQGSSIAIFAFSGFEAVANASEETKNPRRDLPLALFASIVICVVFYVAASFGMSYLVPRSLISYETPFVAGFQQVGQKEMMIFAAFATLLATGATKLVAMYVIPRFFYAMAKDGLLFSFIGYVEPCTGVPIAGLLIGGGLTMLLSIFIKIQVLAEFTSIGIVFSYFVIGLDLIILRYLLRDCSALKERIRDPVTQVESSQDSQPLLSDELPLRSEKLSTSLRFMANRVWMKCILGVHIVSILCVGITLNIATRFFEHQWIWGLTALFGLFTLLTFIGLCLYKPRQFEDSFSVSYFKCLCLVFFGVVKRFLLRSRFI